MSQIRSVLLTMALTALTHAAVAADAPADVDLEFWRSAQRIDTPAAYRAYLDAFPKGAFAALARIKVSSEGAPPVAPDAARATPSGALRSFAEPMVDSGAVTLNLGDRLNGPGWLMLGSLGAKKQIVLPAGPWVLLAGTDAKTEQPHPIATIPRTVRTTMTTLVFGRFAGDRLAALVRVTANTQIAKVASWSDIEGCNPAPGALVIEQARGANNFRDECRALRVEDDPMPALWASGEETRQSLAKLGAVVSGAGLVSTLAFTQQKYGFHAITRIDWPGAVLGGAADKASAWRATAIENSAERGAYLKRLGDWARAYREIAIEGYLRNLEGSELIANAPPRADAALASIAAAEPLGASMPK